MRILMITNTFPPRRFGGVTGVAYSLARKLVLRGHQVTVYTTDVGNTPHSRLKSENTASVDGLGVHYFRNISNLLAYKYRFFTPISCLPSLKSDIGSFDIVHFHDYRSLFNIVGSYFAKRRDIPYVIQAHGSLIPHAQKQRIAGFFDLTFGHRVMNGASRLLALTQTEKDHYMAVGVDDERIEIVPNGIDKTTFEALPKWGAFREKYGVGRDEQIVLYVGRLHRTKGLDLLITAFANLNRNMKNTKLAIVGPDDGFLQALNNQVDQLGIDNQVIITGMVQEEEKLEAYVDADVFVTPNFSGFPLTFIEACASGTPIVTTNKGDMLAWIDGNVGRVVEYNATQLEDALAVILSDSALRERYSRRATELAFNRFNWDIVAERLEEIYQEVIASADNAAEHSKCT